MDKMTDWEEISKGIEKAENAKRAKADKTQKYDNAIKNIAGAVLERTDASKIDINDITDLKSVTDILNKIDEKNNSGKNANGTLPPLSTGKENIIENAVHVTYNTIKQDDGSIKHTKAIAVEDIAKMTPEQISKLITDKENFQNNDNVNQII